MKKGLFLLLVLLAIGNHFCLPVEQRFPRPDFESGYIQPVPTSPTPRADTWQYVDMTVLLLTLSLSSWLVLRRRSRKLIFALMLFSLWYFGFHRQGCICPVGSIQNVTTALFDSTYIIPLSAVVFFILPLIFTLFFGRTFCAAVCPLGAVQDAVIVRPQKIPAWLNQVLGLIPYLYLGFAVLYAATGAGYLICRFDPFVGFFRFGFNEGMFIFSIVIIITGMFIARPYCRFLCPFGVLLKWLSMLSKRHATITPNECIQCHLCADSCPFEAIQIPTPDKYPGEPAKTRRRLFLLLALTPVILVISAWSFSRLSILLSREHYIVQLAEQIRLEDTGQTSVITDDSKAFRSAGTPTSVLYQQAAQVQKKFKTGSWVLGAFIALVFMMKLIYLQFWRRHTSYEPDRANCLSCGRCFTSCPKEHERLHELKGV